MVVSLLCHLLPGNAVFPSECVSHHNEAAHVRLLGFVLWSRKYVEKKAFDVLMCTNCGHQVSKFKQNHFCLFLNGSERELQLNRTDDQTRFLVWFWISVKTGVSFIRWGDNSFHNRSAVGVIYEARMLFCHCFSWRWKQMKVWRSECSQDAFTDCMYGRKMEENVLGHSYMRVVQRRQWSERSVQK